MSDATATTEPTTPTVTEIVTVVVPSPAELAALVAVLAERRQRLGVVQAGLRAAADEFVAGMAAVQEKHRTTAGPLARERDELLAAVRQGEDAEAELNNRRQRAAELRAQLAELEAGLPATPPHTEPTPQ